MTFLRVKFNRRKFALLNYFLKIDLFIWLNHVWPACIAKCEPIWRPTINFHGIDRDSAGVCNGVHPKYPPFISRIRRLFCPPGAVRFVVV